MTFPSIVLSSCVEEAVLTQDSLSRDVGCGVWRCVYVCDVCMCGEFETGQETDYTIVAQTSFS